MAIHYQCPSDCGKNFQRFGVDSFKINFQTFQFQPGDVTMRLKRYSVLALLMVFSVLAFAQTKDLTLDEILDRHFKAQGGIEKMKSVKTIRMTGKMTFGPGMEFPGVLIQSRPN